MTSLRPSSIRLIFSLLIAVTYTNTLHAKSEGNAADKIPNSIPEILSGLTTEILSGLTDNSSPAPAWTKIKETPDGVRYVDYLSIQRVGNKIILWSLTDHKLAEDEGSIDQHLSYKIKIEYDCEGHHYKVLTYSKFSGGMGTGRLTYRSRDNPNISGPVHSESMSGASYKAACGKVFESLDIN